MSFTSRERFLSALNHKEADRIPIHDSPWDSIVDRWRSEDLPSGRSPENYFGYELMGFASDTTPLPC